MAERRPLVIISGRKQELPVGDTVAGATGGSGVTLKNIYTDENLTIADNEQMTGNGIIAFLGTGSLIITGTGRLALV